MAHFACIGLPYLGHLNPMAALARELVRRGHRVTFVNIADVAPYAARRRIDFVAVGARTHPAGWIGQATRNLARADRLVHTRPMMRDFAGLTQMLCDELPDVLRSLSADVVLADQFEAAGGMAAYHVGLPFVSLAAALPLNWDDGIPSPFVGWPPGDARWHRWRNIASAYAAWKARGAINEVIETVSARWRLGRGPRIEEYMSGFAQISQLVPSLDFPRRALIGCFHYCGPLRAAIAPAGPRTPTGRAFASLGTLQGHRLDVFERIARATRACGVELTIAHGGRLAPDDVRRLDRLAEVHAFVDQDRVLAESDVAILHGGLNTVLDACARGVPMVVMPIAFEQAAIAARVERSGAGRRCGRTAGVRRLARAIADVLAAPGHLAAADRLRAEIGAAGGVSRAADIVEHVAATGRPYLNAEGMARMSAIA